MKEKIIEVLRKHTFTVNSFVDSEGKNHFMDCAEEIYRLKSRKGKFYTHLDGSKVCKKCEKTESEGCSCW